MFRSAKHFAGRNVVRFALIGLSGLWLSGCSTDATRLTDSMDHPFTNPFATASNTDAAPTPPVTSGPNTAYVAPVHPSPVASAPLPEAAPATTGALRPAGPAAVGGTAQGWTAVGGSPVLVIQGDTAESLSRRYGVPTAALLGANGLKSASQVHPGMHIIVPVYNAQAKSASSAAPIPAASEPRHATTAVADQEDTPKKAKAKKLASKDDSSDDADAPKAKAKAKKLAKDDSGDAPVKPKGKKDAEAMPVKGKAKKDTEKTADATEAPKSKADKQTADAKPDKPKAEKAPDNSKVASAKPDLTAKTPIDSTPTSKVTPGGTTDAPKTSEEADASGANPEFRWPARGRIIQGFKSGGNDGINISVPEGTSVRAAESGVVAYAGSELKGYGNLVLIRHPNGFVTAYANNGEISVKRGEQVKRGQVIAKSGESGNVSAPQLHFELRDKSGSPVDPTNYLAGI
jgi:murein DD-endopeptidase MepM/ murein hydrolase activator NlpD